MVLRSKATRRVPRQRTKHPRLLLPLAGNQKREPFFQSIPSPTKNATNSTEHPFTPNPHPKDARVNCIGLAGTNTNTDIQQKTITKAAVSLPGTLFQRVPHTPPEVPRFHEQRVS